MEGLRDTQNARQKQAQKESDRPWNEEPAGSEIKSSN